MKAKFVRKEPANKSDAVSFFFLSEHKLQQIAGQYTELNLGKVGKHWFTVSSAPGGKEFSITTRLTGSDFKNALDSLNSGDVIDAAEPMGDFVLPLDKSIPIVMAAGGIGITPTLSMLKDGLATNDKRNFNLIYAASRDEDFVDIEPYRKLLASYKKVVGRLTSDDILAVASTLDEPYIYVSGPEPMVEALVKELKDKGVIESHLVADYFPGYD